MDGAGSAAKFSSCHSELRADLTDEGRYFELTMATYRFMHRPTVEHWLASCHNEQGKVTLRPVRQAVVLVALATASLFHPDKIYTMHSTDGDGLVSAERYYNQAQSILITETGRGSLESVQARLALCLYLLHTSRPNQAWYIFGTTVQLMFAQGIHRRCNSNCSHDKITEECRKRAFWVAATLDSYLSIMLGRPPLIHEVDVDQAFPDKVDDENLTASGRITTAPELRDSVIEASILHEKIVRIVRKAARELYSIAHKSEQRRAELAAKLTSEIAAWHSSLPVVLSGAVHPSSLIPLFRRQITVLKLAHAHALMFINRPMLLVENLTESELQPHLQTALEGAKAVLDLLESPVADQATFPAFWFTQYVSFNALSIIYVSIIRQRRRGTSFAIDEETLLQRAEPVHRYLAQATPSNAPSLRYSFILRELRQEALRSPHDSQVVQAMRTPADSFRADSILNERAQPAVCESHSDAVTYSSAPDGAPFTFEKVGDFLTLEPDLWLQLDSFPFCKCHSVSQLCSRLIACPDDEQRI